MLKHFAFNVFCVLHKRQLSDLPHLTITTRYAARGRTFCLQVATQKFKDQDI